MSTAYRSDPHWIAARARYVAEGGEDSTAASNLLRSILAAREMYEIEIRHGASVSGGAA